MKKRERNRRYTYTCENVFESVLSSRRIRFYKKTWIRQNYLFTNVMCLNNQRKNSEYLHNVFINIINVVVFQHYECLNASRLFAFRFKWSIETHKHKIKNEFCSRIIDMQDADNNELHMTAIYKKSSSSLHGLNSIKLEFLKFSLKEKQFYRWTL